MESNTGAFVFCIWHLTKHAPVYRERSSLPHSNLAEVWQQCTTRNREHAEEIDHDEGAGVGKNSGLICRAPYFGKLFLAFGTIKCHGPCRPSPSILPAPGAAFPHMVITPPLGVTASLMGGSMHSHCLFLQLCPCFHLYLVLTCGTQISLPFHTGRGPPRI